MRIGIEINGVLRDTMGKFEQMYQKLIEEQEVIEPLKKYELTTDSEIYNEIFTNEVEEFKYEIKSDVDSLDLMSHFTFPSKEELFKFMYEDYVMSIFGHASSSEFSTFHDLQDLYIKYRESHTITIVSDEIGKSKPASLFFLSKFGCQIESVNFYSQATINSMWDGVDVLLTANPDLLLNNPPNKIVVKYETKYNKQIPSKYSISKLKEFDIFLEEINKNYIL